MLKKATWKKLFTRNKSKNRDPNNVVCNLCVGMPLIDINSLCDRHRNTPDAPKSPGILKDSKDSGVNKKKIGKRDVKPSPETVPGNNVTTPSIAGNESVVEPAENPEVSEPSAETPSTGKMVAQTENDSTVNPSLEPVEIREDAESIAEKPTINPEKLDRAATNEEFMTEEVDSHTLSENSHTENTVPVVIEPEETPNRESECEDSSPKQRISFTSLLPTKIVEIPSKEEIKEALKMAAAEDGEKIQNEVQKKKYPFKKPQRGLDPERKAAIAIANQTWFGIDPKQPGKSQDIENRDNDSDNDDEEEEGPREEDDATEEVGNEGETEGNDSEEEEQEEGEKGDEEIETQAKEEQTEVEAQKGSTHESAEHTEAGIHDEGTNKEFTHEKDDRSSEMNDLHVQGSNSHSVVINPNLSEPTPLSSLLPNVFINVPKILEYPTPVSLPDLTRGMENEHKVDSQLANFSDPGEAENINQNSLDEVEEDQNTDEGFDEGSEDPDGEYYPEPIEENHESKTAPTFMDPTENATEPVHPMPVHQVTQANLISDEPISGSDDHSTPRAVITLRQLPESEQQTPQTDHTSGRMVFGSIASDFSNQPLFFSPNFRAQRTSPDFDHNGLPNYTEEEPQFPHYSIYDVMKNFIKTIEPSEEDVGRVTEVTDSDPSEEQNPLQLQPEDREPGQSPPSLEAEEEFEVNPETKKEPEEHKELRKE